MAPRSELMIKGLVDDIIKYCKSVRMHKGKAQALSQRCLELSEEYEIILQTHDSLDYAIVQAVLSRTVDCTRRWSKRCLCWQWFSRHSMAQEITSLLGESCETLQRLRDDSKASNIMQMSIQSLSSQSPHPFEAKQAPQSFPRTPPRRPIPLPLSSPTLPRSTSCASLLPTVSQSFIRAATPSESGEHPSPLGLSALSLPPVPDHDPNYPMLFASPSAWQPSRPLAVPPSAFCKKNTSRSHRAPNRSLNVSTPRSPGLRSVSSNANDTGSAAMGDAGRTPVTGARGNNREPLARRFLGPATLGYFSRAHDFLPGSTKTKQKPKLRIKIPA